MQAKHPSFATDVFLNEAEPFMRARYEAEDISYRPLPPVEVEAHGSIELKSVKEIRDKYLAPPPLPLVHPPLLLPVLPIPYMGQPQPPFNNNPRKNFDERQRDRRASYPNSDFKPPEREYIAPKPEDNNSRKILSYLDVDAPKVII